MQIVGHDKAKLQNLQNLLDATPQDLHDEVRDAWSTLERVMGPPGSAPQAERIQRLREWHEANNGELNPAALQRV